MRAIRCGVVLPAASGSADEVLTQWTGTHLRRHRDRRSLGAGSSPAPLGAAVALLICVTVDTERVLVSASLRVEGLEAVRRVAAPTPPPRTQRLSVCPASRYGVPFAIRRSSGLQRGPNLETYFVLEWRFQAYAYF